MITIQSIIAVNCLFIGVALSKDRVECLVFHLDLGSPDTVVPNVLVELASSIFELGLWMQTVHLLAIVGNRGSELIQN